MMLATRLPSITFFYVEYFSSASQRDKFIYFTVQKSIYFRLALRQHLATHLVHSMLKMSCRDQFRSNLTSLSVDADFSFYEINRYMFIYVQIIQTGLSFLSCFKQRFFSQGTRLYLLA